MWSSLASRMWVGVRMCQLYSSFLYFYHWCNQMQVWLPVSTKASTQEAGADVKRKWFIQVSAMQKWGTHISESISTSQLRQRFLWGGRGEQSKEIKGEGWKVLCVQTTTVHSNKAIDGPVCIVLFSHSGFTSSWFHVILAHSWRLMWTLACGVCVLWLWRTNSHGLQKSCRKRGSMATLWVRERAPTPAWTGFYCFSGYITSSRMVLIYYAQVHCRWLPFTDNKGKNVANYFKEKDVAEQGEKWLHSILWMFSTDFRKLL